MVLQVGGFLLWYRLHNGHRKVDPLVRSPDSLTTKSGHVYCLRLGSFQQAAAAPQDRVAAIVYPFLSHQQGTDIRVLMPRLCPRPQAGSHVSAQSAPSSKCVHGFATGFCPIRRGAGRQGGLWMAHLPRAGQSGDRQDLQELY